MKKVKFSMLEVNDIFVRVEENDLMTASRKINPVHNEFGTWNSISIKHGVRAKVADDEKVWVKVNHE